MASEISRDNVTGEAAGTFRCLCRSSPWRWTSLRFDLGWRGPDAQDPAPAEPGSSEPGSTEPAPAEPEPTVRAWLRRPGGLRVETTDGRLLYSTTGINDSRDDFYVSATRKSWLMPPHLITPVYDHQGLVRRRPEAAYGEPVFEDPRFAAMLDPVEFAGNAPVGFESPFANVVEIESLADTRREGRRVLEAVLHPNYTYRPATPGFPLIGAGRTAVRVDWETGVCVWTRALDGPNAGAGHLLRILAVDEYMLDDLFLATSMHLTDVRQHIPWEVA